MKPPTPVCKSFVLCKQIVIDQHTGLAIILWPFHDMAIAKFPASVEVSGAIPKSGRLTKSELIALGPKTATWQVHGKGREVTGVRIPVKMISHSG